VEVLEPLAVLEQEVRRVCWEVAEHLELPVRQAIRQQVEVAMEELVATVEEVALGAEVVTVATVLVVPAEQ